MLTRTQRIARHYHEADRLRACARYALAQGLRASCRRFLRRAREEEYVARGLEREREG
jgi:hypothetical protein